MTVVAGFGVFATAGTQVVAVVGIESGLMGCLAFFGVWCLVVCRIEVQAASPTPAHLEHIVLAVVMDLERIAETATTGTVVEFVVEFVVGIGGVIDFEAHARLVLANERSLAVVVVGKPCLQSPWCP